MKNNYKVSIIVPAHNSEITIKDSLSKIIDESKKIISEIIVVDDCSKDNTVKIIETFENIKLIKLEKNKGAGNARNVGADQAKYENLCFIDSDIIISEDSILNLVNRLHEDDETGSALATQDSFNLNKKEWSSNFVCLKSCYGTNTIKNEIKFSVCCSEFCAISKKLFFEVGKWKPFYDAGGEEFDLGYRIRKLNKNNIKTQSAKYSGYWYNLYERFIRIINRTSKYMPLFFKKKKFDSKGSFATLEQVFSALLTLIIIFFLITSYFFYQSALFKGLIILLLLQTIIELKFLIYATKKQGLKMLIFSLFGIQIINLGILFGVVYFFFKKITNH